MDVLRHGSAAWEGGGGAVAARRPTMARGGMTSTESGGARGRLLGESMTHDGEGRDEVGVGCSHHRCSNSNASTATATAGPPPGRREEAPHRPGLEHGQVDGGTSSSLPSSSPPPP
uniref:Uncharacterized protein n=2 Tax=Oryza TaxID=4527 RepID=A0A0E0N9S1_ORYRU